MSPVSAWGRTRATHMINTSKLIARACLACVLIEGGKNHKTIANATARPRMRPLARELVRLQVASAWDVIISGIRSLGNTATQQLTTGELLPGSMTGIPGFAFVCCFGLKSRSEMGGPTIHISVSNLEVSCPL